MYKVEQYFRKGDPKKDLTKDEAYAMAKASLEQGLGVLLTNQDTGEKQWIYSLSELDRVYENGITNQKTHDEIQASIVSGQNKVGAEAVSTEELRNLLASAPKAPEAEAEMERE